MGGSASEGRLGAAGSDIIFLVCAGKDLRWVKAGLLRNQRPDGPGRAIAFDTRPEDGADAVARWLRAD
jgi:hypothetical protein